MMDGCAGRLGHDALVDVVTQLIHQIGYQDELARIYKEPKSRQARWAAVEEVVNSLGSYEKRTRRPTLAGFLDDVALGDRDGDQDKDAQLQRNAVALMTLHSAKGLEFPQVYLVGMEEGLLPHRRSVEAEGAAIDEERRLCYVGVTRAQERLTISMALQRMKWGKPRETCPAASYSKSPARPTSPRVASAAPWLCREKRIALPVRRTPGGKSRANPRGRPKGARGRGESRSFQAAARQTHVARISPLR